MFEPQSPLGPRKRKESSRVTENADPLLPKNKKIKVTQRAVKPATGRPKVQLTKGKRTYVASTPLTPSREASVEIEDDVVLYPKSALEPADGSDNSDPEGEAEDDSAGPVWIDVDDDKNEGPEDSADAELRACTLACTAAESTQNLLSICRTTNEGLERTYLCLLQANPHHRSY